MKTTHVFPVALSVLLLTPMAFADLWTAPTLVTEIQTGASEVSPFLTYDGLDLYFAREGKIFVATRPTTSSPFDSAQEITGLNQSGWTLSYPWVSPDKLRLYYYQSSGGSQRVINVSSRGAVTDPWMVGNGVVELNDDLEPSRAVANPSLTPDELTIVFAGYNLFGGQGDFDIWMGTYNGITDKFEDLKPLTSVNSGLADLHPRLSADGLTLYFASARDDPGNKIYDLYQATRSDTGSAFGTPTLLSFFDEPGATVQYPFLSADGQEFYFAKGSVGGTLDIYVSHVVPVPGAVILGMLGLSVAGWRLRRSGN